MFRFIEKIFFELLSACPTTNFYTFRRMYKCVSLNNRPYQARPKLVNINSDDSFYYPIFHLLSVFISVVEVVILLMIHML